MPDITITGPTTINVYGATAEDVRTVVAELLATTLTPLEGTMATVAEIVAAQDVKVSTLAAAFTDFAADVRAYLVAHPPTGDVSPADQAAADALGAKTDAVIEALATVDAEVGDADGSDPQPL